MESEPLKDHPITGFTLELDGNHNEISRLLGAIYREMSQIQFDNARLMQETIIPRNERFSHYLIGRLNVKGVISYRKAI